MKVWVFEANLMWSSRLLQSLRGLGHEGELRDTVVGQADVAIINLGEKRAPELAELLKNSGIKIIAHAGHKEKELLELGQNLGVDRLTTNSELTHKLDKILDEFQSRS